MTLPDPLACALCGATPVRAGYYYECQDFDCGLYQTPLSPQAAKDLTELRELALHNLSAKKSLKKFLTGREPSDINLS
jgi:hypothetical protein